MLTTALAILIGYPAAYSSPPPSRGASRLLLFLAVLPFWTNYLIRTYAWIVLLNREGLINGLLQRLGLVGAEPPSLLYTEGAVIARPGLQLPALRHPRLYASLYAAQSATDRGLGRSRRLGADARSGA